MRVPGGSLTGDLPLRRLLLPAELVKNVRQASTESCGADLRADLPLIHG